MTGTLLWRVRSRVSFCDLLEVFWRRIYYTMAIKFYYLWQQNSLYTCVYTQVCIYNIYTHTNIKEKDWKIKWLRKKQIINQSRSIPPILQTIKKYLQWDRKVKCLFKTIKQMSDVSEKKNLEYSQPRSLSFNPETIFSILSSVYNAFLLDTTFVSEERQLYPPVLWCLIFRHQLKGWQWSA